MKKLLLSLFVLFLSLSLFSQTFSKKVISNGEKYSISDSITLKDGHEEPITIYISGVCDTGYWNNFLIKKNLSDSGAIDHITRMLAIDAKYKLKNPQSFTPLKKQFFINNKDGFFTDFNLMGRNGYGNLVETTIMSFYVPFKEEVKEEESASKKKRKRDR